MIKEVDNISLLACYLIFIVNQLQENVEKWKYCWLFQVGAMRNSHLKTVRKLWKEYSVYTHTLRSVRLTWI
jgi:hypothetical protein